MQSYRLYALDQYRHIIHREDFDAADDMNAIVYARGRYPETACELWDLGRKVAEIEADGVAVLIDPA